MIQKLILCASVILTTMLITELTIYDTQYRLPGMELLALAQAGDFSTSNAPLPTYVAWLGHSISGSEMGVIRLGALSVGLSVALTALAGWQLAGPWAAIATAFLFLIFPNTLFHARSIGPEAISMLAMTLCLTSSLTNLNRIHSSVLACIGMTALFACTPETCALAITWLLLCRRRIDSLDASAPGRISVGAIPPGALLPVLVAPAALIYLWPYLESKTGEHLAQYLLDPFYAPHPPIMVLATWIDQTVTRGPAMLTGLLLVIQKVPLLMAILAIAGCIIYRKQAPMAVGLFITLVLVHSLNGSPYYAGIDGMALHAPFLALFGGIMLPQTIHSLKTAGLRAIKANPPFAAAIVTLSLVGPLILQSVKQYPNEMNYQNELVRLTTVLSDKPTDAHLEVSIGPDALMWINETLPRSAEIAFIPRSNEYRALMNALKDSKLLRTDIKPAAPFHADWLALQSKSLQPAHAMRTSWPEAPVYREEVRGKPVLQIFKH